jgi:hypothetical protein
MNILALLLFMFGFSAFILLCCLIDERARRKHAEHFSIDNIEEWDLSTRFITFKRLAALLYSEKGKLQLYRRGRHGKITKINLGE